jgi:peroxiredoxin
MKFRAGASFPTLALETIHGRGVTIPDKTSQFVHLQFRRFAGCPICNFHLRTFVKRYAELKTSRIREVVIFHSPKDSLLPYQGSFPFDVVGDPEKALQTLRCRNVGVCHLEPQGVADAFQSQRGERQAQGSP